MAELIHATCIAIGEVGLLLIGPPGSGKSDLALRLIDQPGRGLTGVEKPCQLVADDQVLVHCEAGALIATPPPALAGLLEVRGLGIMTVSHLPAVKLAGVIALKPFNEIDRLPELAQQVHALAGASLPLFAIDPRQASATARTRAAADWLRSRGRVASRD